MDKNFSDNELSDIMKEIEALEEDFSPTGEHHDAPHDNLSTTKIEEDEPLDKVYEPQGHQERVVSLDSNKISVNHASERKTSMNFKVEGQLNLELKFDIGGQVISLDVTEAGLFIEMEGGVRFSVPVLSKSQVKKAG